jgi:cysteine-rich repeat protein
MKRISLSLLFSLSLPLFASCTLIVGGGNDIAFCGDGELQTGEACDDGNTSNGDGCRADCNGEEVCGDGITDTEAGVPESCDDGNTDGGDGCSADCRRIEECGNNFLDAGEACDDGNAANGNGSTDTCDSNCTATACGNGVLTTATGEECDDENSANGDGCSSACLLEECGNGVADPGEACDDGNGVNGDGCDVDCSSTACGNGIVSTGEACDDGNLVEGDNCDTNCTVSACGNGIEDPDEECDDGNLINGDTCDNNCTATACGNGILTTSTGEACDDGNNIDDDGCTNDCQQPNCGNGTIEIAFNEQCDDGNLIDNDGCDGNCTLPNCGNGVENANEECDDANAVNNDGCTNLCQDPACGDGVIQLSNAEACDDGNTISGDGCSSDCLRAEVCGNNILDAGEACDDGAAINGDGCRADCQGEEECGDGLLDAGEECDDDNTANDDGCSAACIIEECGDGVVNNGTETCDDGNTTAGDGCNAVCADEFCGDGIVNNAGAEECDDNNVNNGDACENDCTLPACFNGISDLNEFCHDDSPETVLSVIGGEVLLFALAGDFNKDTHQDLVINSNSGQLRYLIGDGAGAFTQQQQISTLNFNIAAGDINGDGNLDLAGHNSTFLAVSLGNNNGLFDAPILIDVAALGAISLRDVALSDIDSDGDADVLLPDTNAGGVGKIFVFRSTAGAALNLTLDNTVTFANINVPSAIKIGDFNDDTFEDVAVLFLNFGAVQIHLGNGDSTYNDLPLLPIAGGPGRGLALGDLNSDGHLDVAAASEDGRVVYFNDGNANFAAPLLLSDTSSVAVEIALQVADVNGDGNDDLLTTSVDDLFVNTSNGDGTLNGDVRMLTAGLAASSQNALATADFNEDGFADVVNAAQTQTAQLFFGHPGGLAGTQTIRGGTPRFGAAGDLDGDGDDEFVFGNISSNALSIYNTDDNGALAVTFFNAGFDGTVALVADLNVVLTDMDGDSDLDIVIGGSEGSQNGGQAGRNHIAIFPNQGNLQFGAPALVTNLGRIFFFEVADFDTDGRADLAVSRFDASNVATVAFLRNLGGLTFAAPIISAPIPGAPFDLDAADLNGDGKPELVSTTFSAQSVTLFNNSSTSGTISMGAPSNVATTGNSIFVTLADIDEDGDKDIISTTGGSPNVLKNNGSGIFAAPVIINGGVNGDIQAGDFDNDGDIDLGINNGNAATQILINNGDGTSYEISTFATGNQNEGLAVGDINGDGALDFATGGVVSGFTSLFIAAP